MAQVKLTVSPGKPSKGAWYIASTRDLTSDQGHTGTMIQQAIEGGTIKVNPTGSPVTVTSVSRETSVSVDATRATALQFQSPDETPKLYRVAFEYTGAKSSCTVPGWSWFAGITTPQTNGPVESWVVGWEEPQAAELPSSVDPLENVTTAAYTVGAVVVVVALASLAASMRGR